MMLRGQRKQQWQQGGEGLQNLNSENSLEKGKMWGPETFSSVTYFLFCMEFSHAKDRPFLAVFKFLVASKPRLSTSFCFHKIWLRQSRKARVHFLIAFTAPQFVTTDKTAGKIKFGRSNIGSIERKQVELHRVVTLSNLHQIFQPSRN